MPALYTGGVYGRVLQATGVESIWRNGADSAGGGDAGLRSHGLPARGSGVLAFAEVVQRIKLHLPDAEPVPVATLAAGFCVAQLGLNPTPTGTVVYHNVTPIW